MGEIRKILGKTTFADNLCEYLDMEINQDGVIHLQTNCWRIELTVGEFKQFVQSVSGAAKSLRAIKKL